MSKLYVIDESNLRMLYYFGFMDCMNGRCNMPVSGLARIEYEKLGSSTMTVEQVRELMEKAKPGLLESEPPYDELLRCLENDYNIKASWDGLRKFWNIELTEEGVKLRDATHGTLTAEHVREAARSIQGNLGRCLYRRKDVDEMQKVSDLLFEAANTIESIRNGMLTAEQVREAIERNFGKVAVLDDGKPVKWRDDWVCKVGINYKAIADELNAALGSDQHPYELRIKGDGSDWAEIMSDALDDLVSAANESCTPDEMCEFMARLSELGNGERGGSEPDGWLKCPGCGCVVGYWLLVDDSWTIYMDDYQIPFNNCPNCGKAVER